MAEFAVIGLGRFGRAVVRALAADGQDVLAIDRDPERLALLERTAGSTLRLDTTDEGALAGAPLRRMSTVVVAIGSRATEASLLTVALLRELDIPRIVARAFDTRHGRLLLQLGAHQVLDPEDRMAMRLADALAHPGLSERLRVGSVSLAVVELPEAFVGSTLDELALGSKYEVELLALRRDGETLRPSNGAVRVESGDRAVLLGPDAALEELAALL